MSETKACSLTEDEVRALIAYHAEHLRINSVVVDHTKQEAIERINYLNKRLKAFTEVEYKDIEKTVTQQDQFSAKQEWK